MAETRLGTSGWSYKEWVKVFYPTNETKKLTYYASIFNTVEIDSTFYAYPAQGTVYGWEKNTPVGFVFSAKIPKLITHDKRLDLEKGVMADLFRFLDLMTPLIKAGKLGPVLLQLPPSFSYDKDYNRLKSFIEAAPKDILLAAEFRHLSWLKDEVNQLLRKHNIANVIVDEPLLPPDVNITADFSVVRWHGRGTRPWYNYRYGDAELDAWKPKVDEISKKTKKVYGYFNNHFHGFAVENVLKMLEKVGGASPQQKEVLKKVTGYLDERKEGETERKEASLLEYLDDR
ncbi:MAG: DUF72 domain-containing protein, partial [Thaumarchaeota archaeon]|nr:DUF72 domain-containing protein [Nitrososphaerota archaeon]